MSLYNKLYTLLSTTNRITDITELRIYPVLLPQGAAAAFPAVTYQRVSADRVYSLSGYSTLENVRIQIDCWATSFETVKDLGDKMRQTVDGATAFASNLISDQDLYEDELGVYRVSMDFSLWNKE